LREHMTREQLQAVAMMLKSGAQCMLEEARALKAWLSTRREATLTENARTD
jgi:hypothetical protein